MEGSLGWSTVARLIGTLIGAFACFNLYADVTSHVVITKWAMVRNILTHATRLAAKTGAREPKAATPIRVANVIQHLRDAGGTLRPFLIVIESWKSFDKCMYFTLVVLPFFPRALVYLYFSSRLLMHSTKCSTCSMNGSCASNRGLQKLNATCLLLNV